ncbi:ABC-type transport auxiliary lipoprotein family protein [Allorhizobium sp. BGMRC 0089]|uniref:ABC-type transport auxiliary lipoprotein family protein n=1 Tax=Allorhizobium sonneratiae TaxID=2934936 RepID=UPI0020346CBE|nr:ABC-type transport auxiliary lipoprotein family protein [Allorhizobium sonneratiae]MCM2293719.1 ABC-type transport auxiliary lipoprotein family protein [Allorhizobium sonneratiae]
MAASLKGFPKIGACVLLPLMAAGLAACGTTSRDTYDLASLRVAAQGRALPKRQLLIANPTALKAFDSNMIVVRVSGTEMQYLAGSQWSDTLPNMVQAKLVAAFENTGKLGGVGEPGQGLAVDDQLLTDIRTFEIDTNGPARANVAISVKLLNDRNGTVISQKLFSATVPVKGEGRQAMIDALSGAFSQVSSDIVTWTLASL